MLEPNVKLTRLGIGLEHHILKIQTQIGSSEIMLKNCVNMHLEVDGVVLMDWVAATPKGFRYFMANFLGASEESINQFEGVVQDSEEPTSYSTRGDGKFTVHKLSKQK